ncbi:MAG: hypothetical protein IJX05_04755, partial [Clostridia bacterium]|nr:hypothetical protein [Clostridia bacterium]
IFFVLSLENPLVAVRQTARTCAYGVRFFKRNLRKIYPYLLLSREKEYVWRSTSTSSVTVGDTFSSRRRLYATRLFA